MEPAKDAAPSCKAPPQLAKTRLANPMPARKAATMIAASKPVEGPATQAGQLAQLTAGQRGAGGAEVVTSTGECKELQIAIRLNWPTRAVAKVVGPTAIAGGRTELMFLRKQVNREISALFGKPEPEYV